MTRSTVRHAPGNPIQCEATMIQLKISMPQAKPVGTGFTRAMLTYLLSNPNQASIGLIGVPRTPNRPRLLG